MFSSFAMHDFELKISQRSVKHLKKKNVSLRPEPYLCESVA